MAALNKPLLPKPATAPDPKPESNTLATVACFTVFVAVRSLHPIVIDVSKTDGQMMYGKATPVVMNSLIDIIIGNFLCFALGGMKGLKQCWDPRPLKVFSMIAILYSFGDFLEMQSMSCMGGAAYQLLLQSKLLITALIVWALRGIRQSSLQWNVLLTIALAMSAFVLVDEASKGGDSDGEGGGMKPIGLFFVVAKVFFSCLCAVMAEKALKEYKDLPIYTQVAQLKLAWFFTAMGLTLMFDANVREEGFFSGWDGRTAFVTLSWVCKGWSTFLILKKLDSVLKNIGEAVAIVVIYAFDVLIADAVSGVLPVKGKEFQLVSCLMVLVVVLTVVTYTLAGKQKK